jgi:hypothetical protein
VKYSGSMAYEFHDWLSGYTIIGCGVTYSGSGTATDYFSGFLYELYVINSALPEIDLELSYNSGKNIVVPKCAAQNTAWDGTACQNCYTTTAGDACAETNSGECTYKYNACTSCNVALCDQCTSNSGNACYSCISGASL